MIPTSSSTADQIRLLSNSNLFDASFYLRENPDVASSKTDPATHYLIQGFREKRQPSRLFDGVRYLEENQDIAELGTNPLVHWLTVGKSENRVSPLTALGTEVELLRSSGLIDEAFYLANNPDVAAAQIDPVQHYAESGFLEGRLPSPTFNVSLYVTAHPDLQRLKINPLYHWLTIGQYEDCQKSPLIDLTSDDDQVVQASGLFDILYYLMENPDVAKSRIDPLKHYVETGHKEGRRPSPIFNSNRYMAENPDVAALNENPILHWLRFGLKEGRRPP